MTIAQRLSAGNWMGANQESAKRTADSRMSVVRFTDSRIKTRDVPTDESVGYYHSSADADWSPVPIKFRTFQGEATYSHSMVLGGLVLMS